MVPTHLLELQEWFASIITARMTSERAIQPYTARRAPIQEEAALYVQPSPTLAPHERMQIYNQSYWLRFFEVLEDVYPLVHRLFATFDFHEQLATPYLLAHPSTHWDLNMLGDHFVAWLENNYHEQDKNLVCNAARADWACQLCFSAKEVEPLSTATSDILTHPVQLQPYLVVLQMPYDIYAFRDAFLKESAEYWIEHDFPVLEKNASPYYFVLFRNTKHRVEWRYLSIGEYVLLTHIQNGKTIEAACEAIEQEGGPLFEMAEKHIAYWLQDWMLRGWIIKG